MKLTPVKSFVKQNLPWAFIIGGMGIASYSTYSLVDRINNEEIKAKTYIQNNEIERYNILVKEDDWPKTFNWTTEAKILEQEIKMDSIAKTNYALGMQAVRDSLANANKNNK